jgi:O-antigen/teichoic acid export membrane protein
MTNPERPVGAVPTAAVRGGAITVAANGAAHAVRIGITLVLARLLTPADFGWVAMVAAVLGVAQVVRDMGLSAATVQRPSLSQEHLSTLFWLNVGMGVVMTAACLGGAPLVAGFYDSDEVFSIMAALSAGFFLSGLTAQHRALLRRNLEFGKLAFLTLTAVTIGFGCALALAFAGFGYWALVASTLVSEGVVVFLAWRLCPWRPDAPRFSPEALDSLRYGGHMLVFNLLVYLAYAIQPVLIGKVWDASAAGIYHRAHALMSLPINHFMLPLSMVMVPVLARLAMQPEAFRAQYVRAVRMVAACTVPLGAFCYVFAPEIIRILYGAQWEDSAEVFRWLAVGLLVLPLFGTCAWIYQAAGRMRAGTVWGILSSGTIVAAAVIAVPYGLAAVAASHSLSVLVLALPAMVLAYRSTGIRIAEVLSVVWRPCLAAAIAAAAAAWAAEVLGRDSSALRLGVGLAAGAAAYLGVLAVGLGQGRFMREIWGELRMARARAPAPVTEAWDR